MGRKILAAALLCATLFGLQARTLTDYTVGIGVKPSLALASDGTPRVGFLTESLQGYIFEGSLNSQVNGFNLDTLYSGFFYGPVSSLAAGDGSFYYSFHDHNAFGGDLALIHKMNGQVNVSFPQHNGHDGWDVEMMEDQDGNVLIASIDPPQGGPGNGVELATFDGNDFVVEGLPSRVGLDYGGGLGIDVSVNGAIYISYYEDLDSALFLLNNASGSWEVDTVDTVGVAGKYSELIVDSADGVHLAYVRELAEDTAELNYAFFDGVTWNITPLDTLGNMDLVAGRKLVALAQKTSGVITIAFCGKKNMRLYEQQGAEWMEEELLNFEDTANLLGQTIDVKWDENDSLHIAYYMQNFANLGAHETHYLSNAIFEPTISTDKVINPGSLLVYPVPANEIVIVKSEFHGVLEVISNEGVLLQTLNHDGGSAFSVSQLSSGLYTLRLTTDSFVVTSSFVVE